VRGPWLLDWQRALQTFLLLRSVVIGVLKFRLGSPRGRLLQYLSCGEGTKSKW
jgi:hypothetical protein